MLKSCALFARSRYHTPAKQTQNEELVVERGQSLRPLLPLTRMKLRQLQALQPPPMTWRGVAWLPVESNE